MPKYEPFFIHETLLWIVNVHILNPVTKFQTIIYAAFKSFWTSVKIVFALFKIFCLLMFVLALKKSSFLTNSRHEDVKFFSACCFINVFSSDVVLEVKRPYCSCVF